MEPDPLVEIRALASGVRAVVTGFILIVASFDVRLAFLIEKYQHIFADALPGRPLPALTLLVIHSRSLWTVVALLLPIAAVMVVFGVRDNKKALIALTVLMILIFLQSNLTAMALLSPMTDLIEGMSDGK